MNVYGVDTSLEEYVSYSNGRWFTFKNEAGAVDRFVEGLPAGSIIAMESTGSYGLLLAEKAYEAGFDVYVIPPKRVKAFRVERGRRGKSDKQDSKLIAEFFERNKDELHKFVPLAEPYSTLRKLARTRIGLVRNLGSIRKALRALGDDLASVKRTLASLEGRIKKIEGQIKAIIKKIPESKILMSIPGIGPMSAAILLPVLAHFPFKNKHALVAYCGMDLVINQSGKFVGQCYISKEGDGILRWAFFCAALSACRTKAWKDYYAKFKVEKKLKPTEALCALARKLAHVCFSLYRSKQMFSATT